MKKLQISKDFTFPIDAVTQTFLIVGKRGSGKSNTAARLVEQLHHARQPFVVLDPVDTWWGLKAGRDGGKGLDVYVFGGRKQDLPLEAGGGALIAEVLCEHRISMVLSVKHLSGRARSGFMVAFAQTLFQKWQGGPLHIVLEEAHELAPQMSGSQAGRGGNEDNEAAMLGAFKRLWKLGRASGIGGTAVTQRPASLSKDITTQSEILIAHRTIGPQDIKAVGEWVKYHGQHEAILGELPTLANGQAIVWSPEFPEQQPLGLLRAGILLRDTYDSAATPKPGEQRVEPKELADVDLEKLRTKMAATIERAKSDDPRELKKQLAAKDKQIKDLEANRAKTTPDIPASIPSKPALTDADRALIEKLTAGIEQLRVDMARTLDHEKSVLDAAITRAVEKHTATIRNTVVGTFETMAARLESGGVKKLLEKLNEVAIVPAPRLASTVTGSVRPLPPPFQKPQGATTAKVGAGPKPDARNMNNDDGFRVTRYQQRLLNALAWAETVGLAPLDKLRLALLADASTTSSTFQNNLSELRGHGYIDYPQPSLVGILPPGRAVAVIEGVPTTTDELQAMLLRKLTDYQGLIVRALIEVYPESLEKPALAERIDKSLESSTFQNNLSTLATPALFLEGR